MENRSHALIAGLFVLLLGLAALASVWWFSDGREPTRLYELYTRGNVSGLNLEAQVRYRGMQAGRVAAIGVDPKDPRKLLVTVRVRADLVLTQGTRASLGTQGVTGLAFILLEDDGRDPRPLAAERGQLPRLELQPSAIEQITSNALDAMRRFKQVADELGDLMEGDGPARLRQTLQRLESAAAGLDRTLNQAPQTLAAVRRLLAEENIARLSATLGNLERASGEVTPAVQEFRQLMTRLDAAGRSVEQLAGNAGNGLTGETLPRLDALLVELGVTARRLGQLAGEVEQSPQMLILGREGPLPGPGETGFEERGRP